jgi:hypothetical protein
MRDRFKVQKLLSGNQTLTSVNITVASSQVAAPLAQPVSAA